VTRVAGPHDARRLDDIKAAALSQMFLEPDQARRPLSVLVLVGTTEHQARSTRRGIAGFLRCPVVPQEVASQTRRSDEIQLEPSR